MVLCRSEEGDLWDGIDHEKWCCVGVRKGTYGMVEIMRNGAVSE